MIARGFLTVVIMDMHAAGRMAFHRGRGVIKHGTLRPATDDAVFFVFDVHAIDWDAMLLKLGKWLGLIGCFGHATYTAANWQSTQPLTELEVLRQFSAMKTGETIVDTMAFGASLSGSSSQSSSSDEGASKKLKTTGTYPLNTTDFIPSNKVDVDTALLKKVQSEDVKAEMKRTKEAKEAKNIEASEGRQNAIGEANAIGNAIRNRIAQDAKDAKAAMKAEKQEKVALEMQKIPKSRGVGWVKKRGKWQVVLNLDGKRIHGGCFDDHRGAVAKEQQLREHGQ